MIGHVALSQLFIYNQAGSYCSTVTLSHINSPSDNPLQASSNDELYNLWKFSDTLIDATWTPRGNIVYTTTNKVVLISDCGKLISYQKMINPACLSVSKDDIIYLADLQTGVHQSTDDGVSWRNVFKPDDGWFCKQVVKVSIFQLDDFWALETDCKNYRLRIYSKPKNKNFNSNENIRWKDIKLSTTDDKAITLKHSRLSYDSNNNVILNDRDSKSIYVFSKITQNHRQLLSPLEINKPFGICVDRELELLCIGDGSGRVQVFVLA